MVTSQSAPVSMAASGAYGSGKKTSTLQLLRQLGLAIVLSLVVFGVIAASIYMANQQHSPAAGNSRARIAADRAWQREDWNSAAKHYDEMLAEDPYNPVASFRKSYALHSLFYDALDQANPGTPPTGAHLRLARAAIDSYQHTLDHLALRATVYYNIGCIQARLGQTEEALASVERSIEAGMPIGRIAADTDFDMIRQDPRFQQLTQSSTDEPTDSPTSSFIRIR